MFFIPFHTNWQRPGKILVGIVLFLLIFSFGVNAQKKKSVSKPVPKQKTEIQKKTTTPAEDEKRVKDIVAFLQYVLNTLGSSSTSARDKEVVVTQSYAKIFRDAKVQVEDDLDTERIVITNKDVVAYLKDVDFFFNEVKFEFTIEDIKISTLSSGDIFYKVAARRTLTGTTSEGEKVSNAIPRYIEINYDPASQDLQIVSMYTNEINEAAVLANWWKDLSLEWRTLLLEKQFPDLNPMDSLSLTNIRKVIAVEDLDLSKNGYIQNLDPLDRLHKLKFLNLSGTNISNLTPLRNLTELETLDLSNTKVSDLSPLRYSNKIINLDISNTLVNDIGVLENMKLLENFYAKNIPVHDFSPLAPLDSLKEIDISNTGLADLSSIEKLTHVSTLTISGTNVKDLTPLKKWQALKALSIDSTQVANLEPLSNATSLEVLRANYTHITDLFPLQKITSLKTIYADYTNIDRNAADRLLAVNPKVRIIFDSDNLHSWWNALSPEWKNIFTNTIVATLPPTKEDLFSISRLDSINIAGISHLTTLEPLRKLINLEVIIVSGTAITDLLPIRDHEKISHLDISGTTVRDISMLAGFTRLKALRADNSKIENLEALVLPSLENVYADETIVHDITAQEFLTKNPDCLLVYKTIHLKRWWDELSENWQGVFKTQLADTTRESFHRLVEQTKFQFKDVRVADLNAFSEFVHLKELSFSGTAITTIPKLENFKSLVSLQATNSPIQGIEPQALPESLQHLDLSNTAISDLRDLGQLPNLKTFNCSGTPIKKLNNLEYFTSLEHLDCSNTNVKKLSPVEGLSLQSLNCYNTKISGRTVEKFKALHPDCKVVHY